MEVKVDTGLSEPPPPVVVTLTMTMDEALKLNQWLWNEPGLAQALGALADALDAAGLLHV